MHRKESTCSVAGWLMVLLTVMVPLSVADASGGDGAGGRQTTGTIQLGRSADASATKPLLGGLGRRGSGRLGAARESTTPRSGTLTITNADLRDAFGEKNAGQDADAEVEPQHGAGEAPSRIPSRLTIVEARHHSAGGRVHVAGLLRNDGAGVARQITLEAQARDAGGRPVGTGSSVLSYQLQPGDTTGFSFVFSVVGDVEDVQVRAGATMVVLNEG